jgi:hypothetical protein
MQSYSQSISYANQPQNIVEEVKGWFSNLVSWHRQSFLDLSTKREPDDALPKMLVLFWVLIILCVSVCTAYGIAYHYQIFWAVTGSKFWGMTAAVIFLVIIEITTVFFGLYFFDALLDRLWYKNFKRFVLTLGVGGIMAAAFMWSISISTEGVAELNKALKHKDIYQHTQFQVPAEVAEIDRQISELEATKASGTKSTWKRKPTKEGLQVMQSSNEIHWELLAQRKMLMETAKASQDSLVQTKVFEAGFTSTLLTSYGGYGEYGKFASLFFVSLIGSILREKHKEQSLKKA